MSRQTSWVLRAILTFTLKMWRERQRSVWTEEGSPPQRNAIHRARHVAGHWVWLETSATEAFRAADGTMHGMAFSRDVTRVARI